MGMFACMRVQTVECWRAVLHWPRGGPGLGAFDVSSATGVEKNHEDDSTRLSLSKFFFCSHFTNYAVLTGWTGAALAACPSSFSHHGYEPRDSASHPGNPHLHVTTRQSLACAVQAGALACKEASAPRSPGSRSNMRCRERAASVGR